MQSRLRKRMSARSYVTGHLQMFGLGFLLSTHLKSDSVQVAMSILFQLQMYAASMLVAPLSDVIYGGFRTTYRIEAAARCCDAVAVPVPPYDAFLLVGCDRSRAVLFHGLVRMFRPHRQLASLLLRHSCSLLQHSSEPSHIHLLLLLALVPPLAGQRCRRNHVLRGDQLRNLLRRNFSARSLHQRILALCLVLEPELLHTDGSLPNWPRRLLGSAL
eukprot:5450820-Prymnesium_polylepis.2